MGTLNIIDEIYQHNVEAYRASAARAALGHGTGVKIDQPEPLTTELRGKRIDQYAHKSRQQRKVWCRGSSIAIDRWIGF